MVHKNLEPKALLSLGGETSPTLILFHSASGTLGGLRNLPNELPEHRSAVAFEIYEVPAQCEQTIPAIAREYYSELETSYPTFGHREEVMLIGWSFGGMLALEVASMMAAHGRNVRSVVLVDSGSPNNLKGSRRSTVRGVAEMFGVELKQVQKQLRLDDALELIAEELSRARKTQILAEDLRSFADVYLWNVGAAASPWNPPTLGDTKVILIRARDERGWGTTSDSDLGWSGFLNSQIAVVEVPGTHNSVVDINNVHHVAQVIESQDRMERISVDG